MRVKKAFGGAAGTNFIPRFEILVSTLSQVTVLTTPKL